MIHKNLAVYKLSVEWVVEIYQVTRSFPPDEKFGLTGQIRRAAVSIPANLAEGAARRSVNEYKQFIYIALGSLSELEALIEISRQIGYYTSQNGEAEFKLLRIRKGLHGILRYLNNPRQPPGILP